MNDNDALKAAAAMADRLVRAARRLQRAELEYRRAMQTHEQPRLSKAGTAYAVAKLNLYSVAGISRRR